MSDMAFYIKAFGLCEDENGNPDYGSVKVKIGEFKPGEEIPYDVLIKDKDPNKFLELGGISEIFNLSDVQFMTLEEYEKDYGDED